MKGLNRVPDAPVNEGGFSSEVKEVHGEVLRNMWMEDQVGFASEVLFSFDME